MLLGAVGLTISGTGFRLRMGRTEEKDCFDVVTSRPPSVFGDVAALRASLTSCISATSSAGNWLREGTIQSVWTQRNPGDKKGKQSQHRGFTYSGAIKHRMQRLASREIKKGEGSFIFRRWTKREELIKLTPSLPSNCLLDFWSFKKCLQITSLEPAA